MSEAKFSSNKDVCSLPKKPETVFFSLDCKYPFVVNNRKNKNTEIFKYLNMYIFANLSSDIQTNYLIFLKKR